MAAGTTQKLALPRSERSVSRATARRESQKPMHVFTIPPSVPFLRTLVEALVDGRLVDGFLARENPERLASATLYLPTQRAVREVRRVFLEVLERDAAILPRIVALGDIDED